MKNISNTDNGTCENCGKNDCTRDWNNKDKKKVCEDCWYELGYHLVKEANKMSVYDSAIESLEGIDRLDVLSTNGKEELLRLKKLRDIKNEVE